MTRRLLAAGRRVSGRAVVVVPAAPTRGEGSTIAEAFEDLLRKKEAARG